MTDISSCVPVAPRVVSARRCRDDGPPADLRGGVLDGAMRAATSCF